MTAPRPGVVVAVLVVVALALAACSGGDGGEPAATAVESSAPATSPPAEPPAPAPAPAPDDQEPAPATLPPVTPWVAGPGEVQPEVKQAATSFLETAGTWADGQGTAAAVAARLVAAGLAPGLADAAAPLTDAGAPSARVQVVYPQYGGLTQTQASVMVHLRQDVVAPDGAVAVRDMTLDVRLAPVAGAGWQVTGVAPSGPLGPPGPTSAAAQQALASPNLRLPAAAAADVSSGLVDDRVLTILLQLAQNHVLDVQVLHAGHPPNVFETDRLSNHTSGRAVDVWRIDDQLVVDPATPRALLVDVMTAAAAGGATEVGGPFDLNAERPGFFTDHVHHDHLHIGITEGRPPAVP